MDIFKGVLWYAYKNEWMIWHKLSVESVHTIIEKNKLNSSVASLEEYAEQAGIKENNTFDSGIGEDSLTRFDQPKRKQSFRRKRKKNYRNGPRKKA